MLIRQANQKNAIFYFSNKGLKFQPCVCNRWHELSMMSMKLTDNVFSKLQCDYYRFIIIGINKSEAINFMENIELTEKSITL